MSDETLSTEAALTQKLEVTEPEKLTTNDNVHKQKMIIKQLEYYFGDFNLSRDKFLQEKLAENDDVWVSIETLLLFHRLKAICDDVQVIANAVKECNSTVIQLSEDGLRIRRHESNPYKPVDKDEHKKLLLSRSAYVKGLPQKSTFDEIAAWFEEKQIKYESIMMRRYRCKATNQNIFKGSLFVTFFNADDLSKFLSSGPYTFDENAPELIVKTQMQYIEEKQKERKEKNVRADVAVVVKEPTNAVFELTNVPENVTREDITEKFKALGHDPAFIDYFKAKGSGFVRMSNLQCGPEIISKTNKFTFSDGEANLRLLEGEELKNKLGEMLADFQKQKDMKKSRKGNQKRHGHKHGQKRRKENGNDSPAKKAKASE